MFFKSYKSITFYSSFLFSPIFIKICLTFMCKIFIQLVLFMIMAKKKKKKDLNRKLVKKSIVNP